MKKIKKSVILPILVIMCVTLSLSGCKKFIETDVSAETKPVKQTVSETTVITNFEETQYATEFEITDWTMEDLVTDMEISGQKFSLPCTINEIDEKCNVKYISFIEESNITGGDLYLDGKCIASIFCNGDVGKEIINSNICMLFMGGYEYDFDDKSVKEVEMPEFNVMGITNNSSQDDVLNILGNPNMYCKSERQYRYGFNSNEFVMIDFDNENTDKISLFSIIYNVEGKL